MANHVTVSTSVDCHTALILGEYAARHGITRGAALRIICEQFTRECEYWRPRHSPLPWAECNKWSDPWTWTLRAPGDRVAVVSYSGRKREWKLTMQEGESVVSQGVLPTGHEYALYAAEDIVLRFWPDVAPPRRARELQTIPEVESGSGWRGVFEEVLKAA